MIQNVAKIIIKTMFRHGNFQVNEPGTQDIKEEPITFSHRWDLFVARTSLHGLRHASDHRRYSITRLVWASLVLASIGGMAYFFHLIATKLMSPGVTTKVTVDISSPPLAFPAVTLCNYNQVRLSYVQENPLMRHLFAEWYPALRSIYMTNPPPAITSLVDRQQLQNLSITENMIDAAHQMASMAFSCEWNGKHIPCEEFRPVLTDMGLCYTFNGRSSYYKPRMVNRPGLGTGLSVILSVQSDDYYYAGGVSGGGGSGFRVLVHDQNEIALVSQFGLGTSPGTEALVAVRKQVNKHGACFNTDDKTLKNPLKRHSFYSREACLSECRHDYIISRCGCRSWTEPGQTRACILAADVGCWYDAAGNFSQDSSGRSSCHCSQQCIENLYHVTLSSAKFPAKNYISMFARAQNLSNMFVEDGIKLNVYFEDLSVTTIEQIPKYTFKDVWGDLGGCLGLCFGASLLTIIEFAEFLVESVAEAMSRCRSRLFRKRSTNTLPT